MNLKGGGQARTHSYNIYPSFCTVIVVYFKFDHSEIVIYIPEGKCNVCTTVICGVFCFLM